MQISGFIIFALTVVTANTAHAYIDPGTGATFVGSMAPLIMGAVSAGLAFLLKVFWHPLKRLFGREESADTEQA